ncbi:MAG: ComEC family competence protein [Candidatus Omnitrophica bacterium]|nr:ComEC family competence protein [Candidatus Omnitrophota bacterium]
MHILHNKISLSVLCFIVGLISMPQMLLPQFFVWFGLVGLLIVMAYLRNSRIFLLPYLLFIMLSAVPVTSLVHTGSFIVQEKDFLNTWLNVQGIVDSFPTVTEKGNRSIIKFEVTASRLIMRGIEHEIHERMLVSWFMSKDDHEALRHVPSFGENITIWGKLNVPRKARNQGQFDYAEYLGHKGIYVVLYCFGPKSVKIREGKSASSWIRLNMFVTRLRERIRKRVNEDFDDHDVRSLAKALFIGDRKSISDTVRELFIRAGVMHLLAISGLHVSIVGLFIHYLLRASRVPFMLNGLMTIFIIYFYALLSGYNLPVQRAVIMGVLYVCAALFHKERNFTSTISLSLWFIVAIDPRAIYLPGLQLSFVTVCAIVIIVPLFARQVHNNEHERVGSITAFIERYFVAIGLSSVAALFGAIPLLAFHFNAISLISILSNLVAIPLITVILFLSLMYIVSIMVPYSLHAVWAWGLAQLIHIFLGAVQWFGRFPFAILHVRSPALYELIIYYIVIMALVYLARRYTAIHRGCVYGLAVALLCFLFVISDVPKKLMNGLADRPLQCTVFDIDDDLCLVLTLPDGRTILINAGRGHPHYDAEWVILPYLRSAAVNRLFAVIATSFRAYAWGGIEDIFSAFNPQYLMVPYDHWKIEERKDKFPILRANRKKIIYIKGRTLHKEMGENSIIFITDVAGKYKDMSMIVSHGEYDIVVLSLAEHIEDVVSALRDRSKIIVVIPAAVLKSTGEMLPKVCDKLHPFLIVIQGSVRPATGHTACRVITTQESGMIDITLTDSQVITMPIIR